MGQLDLNNLSGIMKIVVALVLLSCTAVSAIFRDRLFYGDYRDYGDYGDIYVKREARRNNENNGLAYRSYGDIGYEKRETGRNNRNDENYGIDYRSSNGYIGYEKRGARRNKGNNGNNGNYPWWNLLLYHGKREAESTASLEP